MVADKKRQNFSAEKSTKQSKKPVGAGWPISNPRLSVFIRGKF
jgi:hypothetical protein